MFIVSFILKRRAGDRQTELHETGNDSGRHLLNDKNKMVEMNTGISWFPTVVVSVGGVMLGPAAVDRLLAVVDQVGGGGGPGVGQPGVVPHVPRQHAGPGHAREAQVQTDTFAIMYLL